MRIDDLLDVFIAGKKLTTNEVARLERRIRKLRNEAHRIEDVLKHCYIYEDGRVLHLNPAMVMSSGQARRERQEVVND